jgi:tetratricopeptide (TPR) repeat protein
MTVSIFTEANQFLRTGQLDKAVIAYRQAIDQNPNFYADYQDLGETLAKRSDYSLLSCYSTGTKYCSVMI